MGNMDAIYWGSDGKLFELSSLMPRTGEKLSMFVLSHLFSSLFNHAAQTLTSNPYGFFPFDSWAKLNFLKTHTVKKGGNRVLQKI
jgi:hypothetical protein